MSITQPLTRSLTQAITRRLTDPGVGGGGALAPTQWSDTAYVTNQGTHYETSPLARAFFTTDATELTINGFRDIPAPYGYLAELGVIVDDEHYPPIVAASEGAFSETIMLPAGTKTVIITNGPTTRISGSPPTLGTWLKSVSGNAAITQTFPTATNVTLFLADSIGVGDHASNPTRYSYIGRLRDVTTDSLIVYGWGFNTNSAIMGDSTKRAALMAIITPLAAANVVDTLGTNDWALASSTVTDLANHKAALYDDIHAALPSASIYAVKLNIRQAADEATNNGLGFTPDQYRAAFDTAATGRAWVTVVNGKAFMTEGDLYDGVHPSTGGHLLWAQGIDGSLGYVVPDPPIGSQDVNAGPDAQGTATLVAGVYECRRNTGSGFDCGFYGLLRTGDFRYKITGVSLNVMVGLNATPHLNSGYADMEYCIYCNNGAFTIYDNGAAGATIGNMTGDPGTQIFWIDRTGTTVEFRQGPVFSSAAILRTSTLSGTVGLDLCVFDALGTADVTVVS